MDSLVASLLPLFFHPHDSAPAPAPAPAMAYFPHSNPGHLFSGAPTPLSALRTQHPSPTIHPLPLSHPAQHNGYGNNNAYPSHNSGSAETPFAIHRQPPELDPSLYAYSFPPPTQSPQKAMRSSRSSSASTGSSSSSIPALGKNRCYWALLSESLHFLFLDPVLSTHMSEQASRLIGKHVLDYAHPDDKDKAVEDLERVVRSKTLHGSVTRLRYYRLTRVRAANGAGTLSPVPEATLFCLDDQYLICDLVINCVGDNLVLCFFHAIVDKNPADDQNEHQKSEWSNWCGTPTTISLSDHASQMYTSLIPSAPSPTAHPTRVFQVLRYDTDRQIVFTWPLSGYQVQEFGDIAKDVNMGCCGEGGMEDGWRDVQGQGQGGKGGRTASGEARTSCTRRYKAQWRGRLAGRPAEVESVYIPYGSIIFACHRVEFPAHIEPQRGMLRPAAPYFPGPPASTSPSASSAQHVSVSPPSVHYTPSSAHSNTGGYSHGPMSAPTPASYGYQAAAPPPPPPQQQEYATYNYAPQMHPHAQQWGMQMQMGMVDVGGMGVGQMGGPQGAGAPPSPPMSAQHAVHPYAYGYPQQRPSPPRQAQGPSGFSPPPHPNSNGRQQHPLTLPTPTSLPSLTPTPAQVAVSSGASTSSSVPPSSTAAATAGSTSASTTTASGKRPTRPPPGIPHCTQCHTSTSPEWRKGESGRKELCNACGLRWARERAKVDGKPVSRRVGKREREEGEGEGGKRRRSSAAGSAAGGGEEEEGEVKVKGSKGKRKVSAVEEDQAGGGPGL